MSLVWLGFSFYWLRPDQVNPEVKFFTFAQNSDKILVKSGQFSKCHQTTLNFAKKALHPEDIIKTLFDRIDDTKSKSNFDNSYSVNIIVVYTVYNLINNKIYT